MSDNTTIKPYGSMTLKELKDELRKRGARLSGRKKELVDRLEAYDRNLNFKNPDATICGASLEFQMDLPDQSTYKDINSDTRFVPFTKKELKTYLSQHEKELTKDASDLYKEKFLKYVRISQSGDFTYIQSKCRAQMKKAVTYVIDVLFTKAGDIMEAQCECAAGMGPTGHCKHVCALLYGLCQFNFNKEMITEETCTEKLQTFHQCKKFKGSPIKCSDLKLTTKEPVQPNNNSLRYDPRPLEFRKSESYASFFRNHCVGSKFQNIPFLQAFSPANIHAASQDHDYLEKTPEQQFLIDNKLSIINDKDIKNIQEMTCGQAASKTWINERTKRIHSSNFGRICKATERTDKKKLATSLTVTSQLNTIPIKHGKKYEAIAVKKYEEKNDVKVNSCGIFVSKTHPFLGSTPDGIVSDNILIEIKCPYGARDRPISPVTVPYLKETEGQLCLDTNHDYYYQIQGQLFCTGRQICDFSIYTFKDFKTLRIERNDLFIQSMIVKLEDFFKSHFKESVVEKHFYKDYYKYSF